MRFRRLPKVIWISRIKVKKEQEKALKDMKKFETRLKDHQRYKKWVQKSVPELSDYFSEEQIECIRLKQLAKSKEKQNYTKNSHYLAFYNSLENEIELIEGLPKSLEPFVLLHELGHWLIHHLPRCYSHFSWDINELYDHFPWNSLYDLIEWLSRYRND